jgi:hypothetical protein
MRFWTWLLARLVAIAVLLGLALWYRMPDSGEREFRRSLEAMKKVNSLHYEMVIDRPMQHTEQEGDLVCPDNAFHEAMHIVLHRPHNEGSLDTEVVRIGDRAYELQPNGLWRSGYSSGPAAVVSCQRLATNAGIPVLPELDRMVQHGVIDKGDKKTVAGEVCREWRVTLRGRPGPLLPQSSEDLEHRTICIGVDDHLPREMTINGLEHWTYSFNTSTKIEAPTSLVPEPTRDYYQPPPPGLSLSNGKDDK